MDPKAPTKFPTEVRLNIWGLRYGAPRRIHDMATLCGQQAPWDRILASDWKPEPPANYESWKEMLRLNASFSVLIGSIRFGEDDSEDGKITHYSATINKTDVLFFRWPLKSNKSIKELKILSSTRDDLVGKHPNDIPCPSAAVMWHKVLAQDQGPKSRAEFLEPWRFITAIPTLESLYVVVREPIEIPTPEDGDLHELHSMVLTGLFDEQEFEKLFALADWKSLGQWGEEDRVNARELIDTSQKEWNLTGAKLAATLVDGLFGADHRPKVVRPVLMFVFDSESAASHGL